VRTNGWGFLSLALLWISKLRSLQLIGSTVISEERTVIIPFNTGIYTVPEAARLTKVASPRIRRWLSGYTFLSGSREHVSPPVWRGQLQPVNGALALGFLDLMEIRAVDAFLRAGVSWKTLREAER